MINTTKIPRFTLRAVVQYGLIIIGVMFLLSYVAFQARFIIEGPRIILVDEPARVENERTVVLKGEARNITEIYINGRQIFTDEHGNFKEALVLENGYTIVTITAVDRYGRQTQVVRPFIYYPTNN